MYDRSLNSDYFSLSLASLLYWFTESRFGLYSTTTPWDTCLPGNDEWWTLFFNTVFTVSKTFFFFFPEASWLATQCRIWLLLMSTCCVRLTETQNSPGWNGSWKIIRDSISWEKRTWMRLSGTLSYCTLYASSDGVSGVPLWLSQWWIVLTIQSHYTQLKPIRCTQ